MPAHHRSVVREVSADVLVEVAVQVRTGGGGGGGRGGCEADARLALGCTDLLAPKRAIERGAGVR